MDRIARRLCLALLLAAAAPSLTTPAEAGPVSTDDLLNAQANSAEWLMYGRDYRNQRFSPLVGIDKQNVAGLKPVFAFSTGGKLGGLEATPLFRDGVLYFSADYARVFAIDARTGTRIWTWEPEYEQGLEAVLCCGPVNRGLAMKDDLVYVATLDARLVALDRKTGTVAWQQTIDDWHKAYSSTGAPLVVGDKVIAGVAGAEYGIRGYVRAYDAKTGAPLWTTNMIPGPGEPGNETWPGETWKTGGGSTWQTGTYSYCVIKVVVGAELVAI
jgi:alcohol dehydrogenase (cytochrome c)